MQTALFFSPTRVDLYDNIGWLQWSLGRDAVAIATLQSGIDANPDSWRAKFDLGYHYYNTKRYELALPLLRVSAQACDKWIVPAHTYAHALEYTHHQQEALEVWKACVRRFPDDDAGKRNLDRLQACLDAGK
jgi:tetratricopeptide (TPR) repeat protein